ncbi:hypothetical protein KKB44_00685 [Candidatus Micrarchaeota archaeon]|nr:hypothetical protein [Candidatus Micrarchaeota archaeon]
MSSKEIWLKAGKIAKSGKTTYEVWTELKSWAIKANDPLAMKAAVFEFLAVHGTRPEAAPLLPEIMRDAAHISPTLPEEEKKRLIELTNNVSLALKAPPTLMLEPIKPTLPVAGNRPAPILSFNLNQENILTPLTPATDIDGLIKARDTLLKVNENVLTMNVPQKHAMNASMASDKGEELIQSLIEKLQSHSANEMQSYSIQKSEEPKKAKKKPKKKITPKKKVKKKTKPKKAKKKSAKKKKKR